MKSSWLEVDDVLRLDMLYGDDLVVHRAAEREICIRWKPEGGGFLYVDEICSPRVSGLKAYDKGAVLVDAGFAIRVGAEPADVAEHFEIPANCCEVVEGEKEKIRFAAVRGVDGAVYAVAANFADTSSSLRLSSVEGLSPVDITTGKAVETLMDSGETTLSPHSAVLLLLKS